MRNYLISLVLLVGIFAPPPPTTVGRFLYVVSCDARIDKLDTTVGRKVDAYDLAKRTGKEQLIPVVHGPLAGCLSYQALFDVQASVFYTAVPLADQPKPDGTKDYRVLAFSVPGLQLVKRMSGGESLDAPPHLRLDTGVAKIFKASEWSPQSDLDLSAYAPGKTQVPNQVLESSGEKVLLRIFTATGCELVL